MEPAKLALLDEAAPPRRRLRRVGHRLGVHQRQPLDPLRRAAQDLEADIAAHREAAEREALRRRVERRLAIAPMTRDARARARYVGHVGEIGDLAFEQAARVEQARQQDESLARHHTWI